MGKKFLYLVHGQDTLVRNYDFLGERPNADLIQSTYNASAAGAHYFPGSTWAEGRNGLLEKAMELDEEYDYYIFMDDDVEFQKGGYDELEKQLLKLKPAVAIPVFVPKTTHTVLSLGTSYFRAGYFPLKSYQVSKFGDGQVMAFHKDVLADRLLMPLINRFDEISWWYTSSTQQILMHNLYPQSALQLNSVAVTNESHREYTRNSYKEKQDAWLKEQFKVPIQNPRQYAANLLTYQGVRYAFSKFGVREFPKVLRVFLSTVWGSITYKKKESHRLDEQVIRKTFKEGSELYNRYFEGKGRSA
jgi:hypothetical protein